MISMRQLFRVPCLFDFIFISVNNFSVMSRRVSWVEPVIKKITTVPRSNLQLLGLQSSTLPLRHCAHVPPELLEYIFCLNYKKDKYTLLSKGLYTVKPVLSCHSKRKQEDQKLVFKTDYRLNAGQKYCRMLPLKHSAILSTCMKLPFDVFFCLFFPDYLAR